MSTRAVLYARQSKDAAGDAAAVDRQLAECRRLADRNGWAVVAEIIDNDRSATRGERPGWRDLLAGVAAGQYDVLVAWHTDRLYRRLRDLVDLLEVAERTALRIVAVRAGDLDLSTATGRMVAALVGAVAQHETDHKGQRQRAANRQRAERGEVGWSLRPYGYDRRDGTAVIVESEAAVLREVASRVLAGESMRAVIADLDRRGITTTTGGPWRTTPLRRVLRSPRLAGRAVLNGEDFGAGNWPAIFDAETHGRLVAMFADPRRRRMTAPKIKSFLSGILRCGKCGAAMFAAPARKGHSQAVYRCKESAHLSRRQAAVDEYVEAIVLARLSRPDALALLVPNVDLDTLRSQVTELRGRRDALAEMLAEGLLTAEAARGQARKLTDRIAALEGDIAAHLGKSPVAELADAEDVPAAWDALGLLTRREIVKTLMTITVLPARPGRRPFDPASVRIEWRS